MAMTSWEQDWLERKAQREGLSQSEYLALFPPKDTGAMSNGSSTDPWQLTLGRYFIQQLPTIITAAALAVGGCWAAQHLNEGQKQIKQQVEEHGAVQQEIKKAVEQKP